MLPRWGLSSQRTAKICFIALALGALLCTRAVAQNVLLVTVDTLRADHLHCFGYSLGTSPELDQLAASAIRFTRAYTPVPVTLPAHTAILTGTLPPRNGVEDFNAQFAGEVPTLAELFHRAGYATGAIVAAPVLDHRYGLNRGFDFYYDNFDYSKLNEINYDLIEHKANVVVDQALQWLRDQSGKKFFLWVHVYDPHYPYIPPQPFAGRFRHPYDGEIAFADHELGRLFAYLRAAKLYDPAVIAVIGDHGEALGEHGERTHGFFLYDSTLHVPLILKLPQGSGGKVPAHAVTADVSSIDLFPTLLQLAHLPVPNSAEGRSLLPLLAQRSERERRDLFAETELPKLHFYWSDLRSIRAGRYKYILAPHPELYELQTDPHELHNVVQAQQAYANELRSELLQLDAQIRPVANALTRAPQSSASADQDALRSLGYISGPTAPAAAGQLDSLRLPDPKDRLGVYNLVTDATEAAQKGRFSEAIPKLTQALAADPHNPTIHYLLGLYLLRSSHAPENLVDAEAHLKQALKGAPDDPAATYALALAYLHLGDASAAAVGFRRALALDPSNYHAAFNLGVALLKTSDVAGAQTAFLHATQLAPQNAAAWDALARVYSYEGRSADAAAAESRARSIAQSSAPQR